MQTFNPSNPLNINTMQTFKTDFHAFLQANPLCLDLTIQVNIIYFDYKAYDTEPSDPANVLCDVSENLVNFIHKAFSLTYCHYAYDDSDNCTTVAYDVYDAIDNFINEHCPITFKNKSFRNL